MEYMNVKQTLRALLQSLNKANYIPVRRNVLASSNLPATRYHLPANVWQSVLASSNLPATRYLLLLFAFVFCLNTLKAQTQSELQVAFSKSYTFEADKKYDAAISSLNAVYDESSYELNLRLGWLSYLSAKQDQAITYYKKAVELMPAAAEPLWGLLNPYIAKDDWVNAEKTYLSILKLTPKNISANYKLGLIYYYRKNYSLAKKYFDVILNLYPFDYDCLLMSAWTNYYLGSMSEA
nr:tetratricopeptide repeat protein [Bacteroidales bacterium]